MDQFSDYWKEISVLIAGLSAIAGALFEIKDKRTKQITAWGRMFFLITALSLIGGFYAQWQDSASEARRNNDVQARAAETQQDILKLLSRTDDAIISLERVLEPIQTFEVWVRLELSCKTPELKQFCYDNLHLIPDYRVLTDI